MSKPEIGDLVSTDIIGELVGIRRDIWGNLVGTIKFKRPKTKDSDMDIDVPLVNIHPMPVPKDVEPDFYNKEGF